MSIKKEIKETQTQIILEVELPERYFSKEEKITFSIEDARTHLLESDKKIDQVLEGKNLILRNFSSPYGNPISGKFIFSKPSPPKKKQTTPRRRKPAAKTTRAPKKQVTKEKE